MSVSSCGVSESKDIEDISSNSICVSSGSACNGNLQWKCMKGIKDKPPIVPCYHPYRVELTANINYSFCTCGRSKTQPWCVFLCYCSYTHTCILMMI
mgnify:CR=1 FL=1